MKFQIGKQTQYTWFNKLIATETYGSGINIVVAYSTTIFDKLQKKVDVSFLKINTFYLTVKISTDDMNSTYYGSNDRVLYAAEAKCNHVIGFGSDQLKFTEKDVVGHVSANGSEYFFIELSR